MSYQNISFDLSQEDMNTVLDAIRTINEKLPFLITLSSDERMGIVKLGPKSADFVDAAHEAVAQFSEILPAAFNAAEFSRDTALFRALTQIKMMLDSLSEKVDNTHMAVGSEAMTEALEVYAYVQTASDRTPGLKSVAKRLKERFKNRSKSEGEDAPENP